MPFQPFQPGNHYAKLGGIAKANSGFKQQAQAWVKEVGFDKLVDWVNGDNDRKSVFAAGLLFSYALGKPAEKLQIDDRKELYVTLAQDPELSAIAKRFGIHTGRILEARDSSVADGSTPVQTESTPTRSV